MTEPKTAGYGSWKSPITSDLIASGAVRFDVNVELECDDIYWVEMRPTEAGRCVVVRRLYDGRISDVTPLANLTSLTSLNLCGNQISDISPLVDNEGLSEGDEVYLFGNPLSSDSVYIYIPQLWARGVTVVD